MKFLPVFLLVSTMLYGQTNPRLKRTIDSLFEVDQNVQLKMLQASSNKASTDSMRRLYQIEVETFNRQIPLIGEIFQRNGYPSIDMVGKESSKNFFVLIQHADSDPKFQASMLPVLEKLSKTGKVSRRDYAYLYDRVQRNTGRKQLYGTQLTFDSGGRLFDSLNKIIYPKDLADPANVDKRRKAVGLEPIETYYEQALIQLGRPRAGNKTTF